MLTNWNTSVYVVFLNFFVSVCVDCLFLRSPSRVPYRTELIPRAPKGPGGVPGPPTRNRVCVLSV